MAGRASLRIMVGIASMALLQDSEAQLNFSLDFDRCTFDGFFEIYGWTRPGVLPALPPNEEATMTSIIASVVTVVNRALNSTTVTTSLPPGWTPPPINAAGTQTHVVELPGSTVTLAFPSAHVRWPTVYTICPQSSCNSLTPAITTTITALPPQPTELFYMTGDSDYMDSDLLTDPGGLLAMPVVLWGTHAFQPGCAELLGPYNPIFKCAMEHGGGPVWGGLDKTWMKTVTSTTYLDAKPTAFSA